jgi:hypothetical protein
MSFARVAIPLLFFALAAATAGCAMDDGGAASGSSSGGELTPDFVGECEEIFGCGCEHFNFADVDACVAVFEAEWAGVKARAAAAGLTADSACFQSTRPFASYGCKNEEEWSAAMPACSYCQHAHGSKGAGEPCTAYDERTSDCAQGLRCSPGTDPICEDPCGAAGEGQSCERIPCAEGLFCDEDTRLCMARGDLGDTCTNNLECEAGSHCGYGENSFLCVEYAALGEPCGPIPCAEGLACSFEINTCVPMSGLGEPCDLIPCAEGLACSAETPICVPMSGLGEPCDLIPCAEMLSCDPETPICVPTPGLGEPCGLIPCAEVLFCDPESNVCAPKSGPGEPCGLVPCAENLACDPETGVCGPKPGLGEPCDLIGCAAGSHCADQDLVCIDSAALGEPCDLVPCAEGLVCNSETLCAPMSGPGEPCDLIPCAEGLVCNPETILCAPISGPGEPCGPIPCADGLLCDKSAICVRLPTAGEPCAVDLYGQDAVCAIGHFCGYGDGGDAECIHQQPLICAGYY